MNITKRFIYLLILGIPFLTLGYIIDASLVIFIGYNLLVIAMLVFDYSISRKEIRFRIQRTGNNKLTIYEQEPIGFSMYNASKFPIEICLKDEIPEFHFQCDSPIVRQHINTEETKAFEYYVMPTKRGAFVFGNIHLKISSKFKLCIKEYKIKLPRQYKVYPHFKNLDKFKLRLRKNPMLMQGVKVLKIQGKGTSFESLREYITGDEYKKINWKASARADKPIVNQYEPEKNQRVYLFIDTGRSMSYTVRDYRKLDMTINTAILLSDIVNQNGDLSGLVTFNTHLSHMIMASKGTEHRNNIIETLYNIESTKETSNYEEVFYEFKEKEKNKSIIFIFTDFDIVEESKEMMRLLPILSRLHVVVIVFIKDEDIEDIVKIRSKDKDEIFNKAVALDLLRERSNMIRRLNTNNAFCIECPKEKLQIQVINKYLEIKNKTHA